MQQKPSKIMNHIHPLRWLTLLTLIAGMAKPGICQPLQSVVTHDSTNPSILQMYGTYLKPENEILARRDRTSRHYRIDDHTFLAALYSSPVFYRNEDGDLDAISNMIIPGEDKKHSGFPLRNKANGMRVYFSDDAARCIIDDEQGNTVALLSSSYATRAGVVAISGNHFAKTLEGDSSVFVWTVQGSGISYRLFVNRKLEINDLKPLVNIHWRQPMITLDHSRDQWKKGRFSTSTVASKANPEHRVEFSEMITQTDTTTTLLGSVSLSAGKTGSVIKASVNATPVAGGSHMRIQNLSDPGCYYGFRSWAMYDLSSLSSATGVTYVEQHLFVDDVTIGFFDLLDMNVTHLINNPETRSAQSTWWDIEEGTPYVYDRAVSQNDSWESWAMTGASKDLFDAISSPGWFALGYMVWCDEDNSDFYAEFNGSDESHPPYLLLVYTTPTGVADKGNIPSQYMLSQNYPNPFNPTTSIDYAVQHAGKVRLIVCDELGRDVATLVDGVMQPGKYTVRWNATGIASGTYFYRIEATTVQDPSNRFADMKKLLLLK